MESVASIKQARERLLVLPWNVRGGGYGVWIVEAWSRS